MVRQAPAFTLLLVALLVATGAAPALATGNKKVTNVACSAGMVAVKFGKGILCVTGPGGSNELSGNQVASGNGVFGSGEATTTTTAGSSGGITGRKLQTTKPKPTKTTTTNVACSAGEVGVFVFGKGIVCVTGAGGSNVASGNQVLSGNGVGKGSSGSATAVTTAGDSGSIVGRKLLTDTKETNVACSAGTVAVKWFGQGIVCMTGAGGSNIASGNQVGSGNGIGKGNGAASTTTTAGNSGSIIG